MRGRHLPVRPVARILLVAVLAALPVGLAAVSCGTEIHIEQAGVPAVIPAEACYLGWQESLNQLALLIEPEIPG